MIKQNNNLIQNYTESDLQSFAKLGDFSNYNVVLNDTKNNEKVSQSVDYTLSDKKQFKKLMNFNKNIKTASIEYFIDNFSDSDDLTYKRIHKEADSFYNESDIQNFKNFEKFSLSSSSDTLIFTNKKENSLDRKINYTVSDLEIFDELKKQETIHNKERIEKIIVKYFD